MASSAPFPSANLVGSRAVASRTAADTGTSMALRSAYWCLWLAAALFATTQHVMWRDEIRALTLARHGSNVWEMIYAARGYGHPTLWHILLRGALSLYDNPVVLAVVAFAIGAAASALLAFKAPFRPLMLALALFSAFSIYEYVAVARNYGLGMFLLFTIAATWKHYRDRAGVIAGLLFLLCNTNIHSVVLAGALLLFWFVELVQEKPSDRRAWTSFAIAAAAVLIGAAACAWQVYPPVDSAVMPASSTHGVDRIAAALTINLGAAFHELLPAAIRSVIGVIIILPMLFLLSISSLRASTGAMVAAAAALAGMTVVFATIYPGSYRHQALFIVFLLTLTWIVRDKQSQPMRDRPTSASLGFLALLALQLWSSVAVFTRMTQAVPESRSRDLAALLARPSLHDAIVIGDPDTMLEAVPYYVDNRVFLVRERRYSTTVTFSNDAKTEMSIGKLLNAAKAVHARTGRPIVIVLQQQLDPGMAGSVVERGYYGPLRIDPAEVRTFLASTRRIARFAPAASDESYDVYTLGSN